MYIITDNDTDHEISSAEDLKEVSTAALVETHNELAEGPVKKFRDRATAEARVWRLIQEVDVAPVTLPRAHQPSRRSLDPRLVVRMLVTENPKRPGSLAAGLFDNYRDGMTVAELHALGVSTTDIKFNLTRNFIALETTEDGS